MPKRKAKSLTLKGEKKKQKKTNDKDNLSRKERRSDPEYRQRETSRDESTRRKRFEDDPDYEEVRTRKNSARQSRRSNPEYLHNESERDKSNQQKRRSEIEYLAQQLSRDNSTRRFRREDPEYLHNESERDKSNQQKRRSDPEYLAQQLSRDNSTRRSRREDPEYLHNESERDKSNQLKRRSDPEYLAQQLSRDNSTRRSRREDPEYLHNESERDKSNQQKRRSDPEYLAQQLSRDNSTRRSRRENPEYLHNESERDKSNQQKRRSDPEYLAQQLSRDNSTRRSRRENPEYLHNESERDKSNQQKRRSDPEYLAQQLSQDNSTRRSRREDPEYLHNESERDKLIQRKRRSIRESWAKALETYNKNIKDGPFHRCYSCDRLFFANKINTTDRDSLMKNNNKITDEFLDSIVLPELLVDVEYSFCSTCITAIRQKKYPRYNINHSNLRFPDVPDVVKNLTPLAERCVAARIPFMKIEQVSFDKQLKIKSGVVNVPIDVRKTVESISRPPEESGVIEISLMRRMEYKNAYLKEMIRPADVWAAARLLCGTPLYKRENITMNPEMDPNLLSSTATDDMNALRIADSNQPEEPVPGPSELSDRHLPEETLLDSTDAVRFAPGEGENPIPMYMDPYCEELAFPTIWFGHPRGVPPKGIRLSFLDHINSEIRRFDRRACRPDHILFLHKKAQIEQLTKQVNIVLRKSAQTNNITAAQVRNKQFIDNAVNNDSAYRFMSAITGSPAYFEAQKKKIMATVRQTGGFTFFITMSAAETHWPELLVILKKTVDKEDITEEQVMELTFEEKARLISNDPSTCALYYNYRLRENWKLWEAEDGPFLGYKIGSKTCRIEFQHRGSPHAHQFVLLVDAPKFDSDDPESYGRVIEFIDRMITTDTDDPEVADIIYSQRHRCTHTCRKGKKGKETCRFNAPFLPMPRTMILEPILDSMQLSKEKQDRLKDINKKLHDTLEADSASIQSFDELLQRLECNFDDYLLAARSKLKNRKVFIKREPKNSRINPYNKKILITMRSNMDIQFILDIYSCISYVVDYVNKSDKGLSRLLRKCVEEYKNGNASIKSKLSAMSKIMYNCSETSAQEASWIRSRLPMCMSTDVVEFISSGPKATRQLMLKSNAELKRIAESNPDSVDIYKKGPIDRYADRPDELENICLADFIALYNYHTRGKQTTTDNEDDAPEDEELELIDDANDNEQTVEKKGIELKNNSGYLTVRRRPKIIRYVRFNRHEDEANYFREMVLLFLPWRNEDEEVESQDCAKKFEENEAVIKRNYDKYNAVSLDIDAILQEIQNDRIAEENNEIESNNGENVDPNFQNMYDFDDNIVPNAATEMGLEAPGADITASRYQVPNMIRDDEYLELCDSLNTLQRDFLMHLINDFKSGSNLPVYYFLSGGAGVGKSRLINAIYQSIVRLYRSEPGPVDSNEVLLVAYTGMAAHNIGGITAHSAFHLSANQGKTDVGLSPDIANTMACQLQRLKLIIIDEISMLGAEHFDQISLNLKQAFRSTREFAGRSVIVVGDFNQLRPVGASYVFTNKRSHHRNSLTVLCENPQWSPFRLFELTEIMRQKDDLRFAEALTRLAYGRTTAEDNSMISSRCFNDEDSLPLDVQRCLRLIATNKEVDMFNSERARQMVNDGAQKYTFTAVDSFVGTYTNSQKNKARHELEVMDKKNTQNLIRQLDLIIGLRYMVSTNIDVSDGLFNGASGILRFVEISNRKINCVYIEFDDESIGGKTRASRYQVMTTNQISNRWTPIKTTKKSFYTCQGGSVQVAREQFPLVMAEAITIHKSQGRSESKIVIDVRNPSKIRNHMDRQKWYVALSRARSLNGLYILGTFKPPSEIKPNDEVNAEMNRLRQNPLVPKYQFLRIVPENVIQITSHNTQSIRKHITTIVSDQVFMNSNIVTLQECWAIDNESYNIPDFEEISRNRLMGRPRAFGTINFCKLTVEPRITDRIEIENGNSNNHVEISGFKLDNRLTIINIYNNPSSSLDLLKETLLEVKDYIDESENILILGDFNHELKLGSPLEMFMLQSFGTRLFSPRELTTNARTVIDGVFGRIEDYNVEVFIYESYSSHHKPLVIRVHEL